MGLEDRQVAYHALRGVLYPVRDRLEVNEAFDLAAQLPMLVRGIYEVEEVRAMLPEEVRALWPHEAGTH
ncbi:DUF2267 domain-containing protein [Thiohalorhabdus methylotrophus]|uniref:DUF2267 domain-containing protein n=1 Tax=Thiohalorhabdus methylotrophus TaxID=3242694 RepID=A0ABV4TQG6_9GAMM